MIEYIDHYTREFIRANPEKLYVFGDNAERVGLGGQAGAARGEPNSIGIATKWKPSMTPDSFFRDGDLRAMDVVHADLMKVKAALHEGRTVVVPSAGVGTGLSCMPEYAPKLLEYIDRVLFPK